MQETTSSNDANEDFEFIKKREARQAKIEQIEVALRVGDVASLRNLASQTGGLLEDRLRRYVQKRALLKNLTKKRPKKITDPNRTFKNHVK